MKSRLSKDVWSCGGGRRDIAIRDHSQCNLLAVKRAKPAPDSQRGRPKMPQPSNGADQLLQHQINKYAEIIASAKALQEKGKGETR